MNKGDYCWHGSKGLVKIQNIDKKKKVIFTELFNSNKVGFCSINSLELFEGVLPLSIKHGGKTITQKSCLTCIHRAEIEKLIGRKLTWKDEPVELEEDKLKSYT